MPSVVIHRYVKVGGDGVGRAKAHIRYIQHRRGEDREHEAEPSVGTRTRREFFDDKRDQLDRRELNNLIDREPPGGVAIHKLTLSPGVQGVDLKEYTREVMDELAKAKGLDLHWAAVPHKNTNHDHVHVVVLGTDMNGRQVRLDKTDHDLLRYKSDQYLDREHAYDRELSRQAKDVERVEKELGTDKIQERLASLLGKGQKFEEREPWSKERALAEMPQKDKIRVGGRTYTKYDTQEDLRALDKHLKGNFKDRIDKRQYAMMQRWIEAKERHGDDCHERWDRERWQKKRTGQRQPDRHELDKSARAAYQDKSGQLYRRLPRKQWLIERDGSRSEYHATYMNLMAKQRLMQARERATDAHTIKQIDKEMDLLKQLRQEQLKDIPVIDLDSLYGKGKKDRQLEWKRPEPEKPFRLDDAKFEDLLFKANDEEKQGNKKQDRKQRHRDDEEKENDNNERAQDKDNDDQKRDRPHGSTQERDSGDSKDKFEGEKTEQQEKDEEQQKKELEHLRSDVDSMLNELQKMLEELKRREEEDERDRDKRDGDGR